LGLSHCPSAARVRAASTPSASCHLDCPRSASAVPTAHNVGLGPFVAITPRHSIDAAMEVVFDPTRLRHLKALARSESIHTFCPAKCFKLRCHGCGGVRPRLQENLSAEGMPARVLAQPIFNLCYTCLHCPDFHLCHHCAAMSLSYHEPTHVFMARTSPSTACSSVAQVPFCCRPLLRPQQDASCSWWPASNPVQPRSSTALWSTTCRAV